MSINFAPLLYAASVINWPSGKDWLFVALITVPALILGLVPFLRLNKKRRTSSKHLIPFIIHMSLILILSFVFAGISKTEKITTTTTTESVVMFVVDMSDSSAPSKDRMNQYMHDLIDQVTKRDKKAGVKETKFGLLVFGGTENEGIVQTKNGENAVLPGDLNKDTTDFLSPYLKKDNEKRDASNIAQALSKVNDILSDKDYNKTNKKVVLLSDGRQIGGNALEAADKLKNNDISLSCMLFDFVNDETEETYKEIQVLDLTTNGKVTKGEKVEAEVVVKSTYDIANAQIILSDVAGNRISETKFVNIPKGTSLHTIEFEPEVYTPNVDPDDVNLIGQGKVDQTGVQAIRVDVKLPTGNDVLPLNNTFYSWYTFETKGKILIVYGDSTQLSQIEKAGDKIDLSEYDVEKVSASQFPRSLEKMLEYDEIVFMNVDYKRLTDDPDQAIKNIKRYVEEVGRGVLFTTGDNIFDENGGEEGKGAFVDSPINDLFPVKLQLDEEKETIGMVLVVDLSSSMKEQVSNSGVICKKCDFYYDVAPSNGVCSNCEEVSTFPKPTRYHVVLESVKKVVRESTFAPEDYIGVIVFDQDYHVALEIQPIGDEANREILCEKMAYEFEHYYYAHYIDKLTGEESDIRVNFGEHGAQGYGNEYLDGPDAKYTLPENYNAGGDDKSTGDSIKSRGTSYKWPIQEASAMLARAQNMAGSLEIKQVVFMSDGSPNDKGSGYEGIVERMAKGGTVTSTIAIGTDDAGAIAELEKISVAGKGDIFKVDKASDLNKDLAGIVESIKGELLNKDITVLPMRDSLNSTVHEGMADIEYDYIHGYYGSQIKENAERVIYVDNLRPLYAEWEYGLGKVCIFMSDLGNEDWTGEMFDDTDGKKNTLLIKNILTAPIQKRIDSTGIECDKEDVVRDEQSITITVETYTDLSLRDTVVNGVTYKDVIKANIYKFDEKTGTWQPYTETRFNTNKDIAVPVADRKYQIVIPTNSIEEAYVVILEISRARLQVVGENTIYQNIDYSVDNDDAVKDRRALIVAGGILAEYDILQDENQDGKALLTGLSAGGRLLELNGDDSDDDAQAPDDSTDTEGTVIEGASAFDEFAKPDVEKNTYDGPTKSMDIPLIIFALILFVLDLVFRNFVIKRRRKPKEQMSDEEQIESMRGR